MYPQGFRWSALPQDILAVIVTRLCAEFNLPIRRGVFVGSCNDFLCLFEESDRLRSFKEGQHSNPVYICNPVTGKYIERPRLCGRGEPFGFCYSCKSNEFKVLGWLDTSECVIFSSRTGTWRNMCKGDGEFG